MTNNPNNEAYVIFNETQGKFCAIGDGFANEFVTAERLADAYFWPTIAMAEQEMERWKEDDYYSDDDFAIRKVVILT